jgi:hypothetical protein
MDVPRAFVYVLARDNPDNTRMANPDPYEVSFSFAGFQATSPQEPLPGGSLDNELANIATALNTTIDALQNVRRADGALVNGIVTLDSLADEVTTKFQGASAYQLAVANGFVGTEAEWLASLDGADGADGSNGAAATVQVGTITTLAPGANVTVTNSGTANAAVFNFGIPQGAPGAAGAGTGDMLAATYDPNNKGGDAFAMANMVEDATHKVMTGDERTKLASVASGATANDTDANLKNRANHTGTQAASTISDFSTAADARISAAIGSTVQAYSAALTGTTASFTTALKTKLDGIAAAATANDTDANLKKEAIIVAVGDETSAISAGTAKVKFRMPYAFTLQDARASLTTAQASGAIFTIDINENGTSVLSTKLTIDNAEKTSTTAATAVVISDTSLADDAEMSIDIDQVGSSSVAAGLKVTLIGYRT